MARRTNTSLMTALLIAAGCGPTPAAEGGETGSTDDGEPCLAPDFGDPVTDGGPWWRGSSVLPATSRDVDGDGSDDFAFRSGISVAVVHGPLAPGPVDLPALVDGGGGFWVRRGPMDVIYDAAIVGDLDGDGLAEVAVAAATEDCDCGGDDGCFGTSERAVYIVRGGVAGGSEIQLADLAAGNGGFAVDEPEDNGVCGGSLPFAALGDIDGDALADVVIDGRVLLGGGGDQTITTDDLTGPLAWAPAGDVDGDGIADFARVEDPGLMVYLGAADLAVPVAAFGFSWQTTQSGLPLVVALGDVNGDGAGDLGVMPPGIPRIYVVFGRSDGALVSADEIDAGLAGLALSPPQGQFLGNGALTGIGDFDGDGLADLGTLTYEPLVISVVHGRSEAGAFVLNEAGVATAFTSCLAGFGGGPVGPGDLDGDGLADLLTWGELEDGYPDGLWIRGGSG